MLIQCSECKKKISSKASACPRCGMPLHSTDGNQAADNRSNYKVLEYADVSTDGLHVSPTEDNRSNAPEPKYYTKSRRRSVYFPCLVVLVVILVPSAFFVTNLQVTVSDHETSAAVIATPEIITMEPIIRQESQGRVIVTDGLYERDVRSFAELVEAAYDKVQNITVKENFTIRGDAFLLPEDTTLIIPEGITLIYETRVHAGKVINNGTVLDYSFSRTPLAEKGSEFYERDVCTYMELLVAKQENVRNITIKEDMIIAGDQFGINEHTTLIIAEGVNVTVETLNFFVEGTLTNYGTVDVTGRMVARRGESLSGVINSVRGGIIELSGIVRYGDGRAVGLDYDEIRKYLSEDSVFTLIDYSGGEPFTLIIENDLIIPEGKTLRLNGFYSGLKINEGATLTVNGWVMVQNDPVIEGKVVGSIHVLQRY